MKNEEIGRVSAEGFHYAAAYEDDVDKYDSECKEQCGEDHGKQASGAGAEPGKRWQIICAEHEHGCQGEGHGRESGPDGEQDIRAFGTAHRVSEHEEGVYLVAVALHDK